MGVRAGGETPPLPLDRFRHPRGIRNKKDEQVPNLPAGATRWPRALPAGRSKPLPYRVCVSSCVAIVIAMGVRAGRRGADPYGWIVSVTLGGCGMHTLNNGLRGGVQYAILDGDV